MPLIKDIKNDIREAQKIRFPFRVLMYWMVFCLAFDLSLLWLGKFDLGLPALNSFVVIGFTVRLKRKQLGHHVWFWLTVITLAAFHVPLVLFVPWTSKWVPALAIAALDSMDVIVMLTIIAIVGRLVERPR